MAKAKMTGLGKGLDVLFGGAPLEMQTLEEENTQPEETADSKNLKTLRITEVEPNREQPRKNFNQESLEELSESIKTYGIIQPIIVEEKEGYYRIIAGERRWRAAKIAGIEEIPCIIRNESEQRSKEISLIENIQRENLNPIEKAVGYKELIDNYNLKQQELADKLGIKHNFIKL